MSELLERVEEQIRVCEEFKAKNLEYYIAYWSDEHDLLITIKKELEIAEGKG
jgi:hypothetical protein